MSIHHQVIVPPNIAELVEEVTCKFHGTGIRTKATMRYEMPHAWYAVLLRCGVPDAVQLPANSTVEVSLRKGHPAMHHTLQLRPYAVEEPSITPNVAFCLSPVFGKLDIFKILEWRLHHARIGVKTVHWYSREANPALKSLVNVLNHNEGLKDTWKDAVPLSPDTFQTERLQEHGLYGDQVILLIQFDLASRVR